MQSKKNTVLGKVNIFLYILFICQIIDNNSYADNINSKITFAELYILDKVSSKTSNIKIKIGEKFTFQNLEINVLKCQNSKFDDDPEITAYMQVIDLKDKNKDKVYIFNDWTFASSPSIRPFDHPVYDIWLKKCYN
jgi:hypothetical protein|tara:strand:- start:206 stop:613 length:408 start_codon:yes stop_codon:yes gene_type:complete